MSTARAAAICETHSWKGCHRRVCCQPFPGSTAGGRRAWQPQRAGSGSRPGRRTTPGHPVVYVDLQLRRQQCRHFCGVVPPVQVGQVEPSQRHHRATASAPPDTRACASTNWTAVVHCSGVRPSVTRSADCHTTLSGCRRNHWFMRRTHRRQNPQSPSKTRIPRGLIEGVPGRSGSIMPSGYD